MLSVCFDERYIMMTLWSFYFQRSQWFEGLPWYFSWWRICLQYRRPQLDFSVRKIPWRRDRVPTPLFWGFPGGSDGKESTCDVGDLGSIPGLGRSPGGRHGHPLQYSCLERIPTDRAAWQATVCGVAKSWTWLSNSAQRLMVVPCPFPSVSKEGFEF